MALGPNCTIHDSRSMMTIPYIGVLVFMHPPWSMKSARLPNLGNVKHQPHPLFSFLPNMMQPQTLAPQSPSAQNRERIRIGIVGGGLAGVTVAHALGQRSHIRLSCEVTVLEADEFAETGTGQWAAATARNANSLVPGAAMHVFSKKAVLVQVLQDQARQWYWQNCKRYFNLTREPPPPHAIATEAAASDSIGDFSVAPPYFAFHPMRCLGPTATNPERWSFFNYVAQYLYACFWLGDEAADRRGERMCQLAQANRVAYTKAIDGLPSIASKQGLTNGFLACFRNIECAHNAVLESQHVGEEARVLEWSDAVAKEPSLENIPIRPLYAVLRPNDKVASCEKFIHHWIRESRTNGIVYKTAVVDRVLAVPSLDQESKSPSDKFLVVDKNGTSQEFDILILAAGVHTPLLANQLGVARYCPTYPLRGYSLTLHARPDMSSRKNNLLRQPFSIDSMYFTSVSGTMARIAGYGEFVGYRDKAIAVPSLAPPTIVRYAKAIFGEDFAVRPKEEQAMQCFRPISPDDLPLVGEVPELPGLFLHTGHGTLGWSTSLSTGECLAQAITDRLEGRDTQEGVFVLPDQSTIERRILSPVRFR